MPDDRFGFRLKVARLAEGFTQAQLAKRIGVTAPTICNWETGNTAPGDAHIDALERILGPLTPEEESAAEIAEGPGAFGAWLRKTRDECGMSVPELATKSGVTAATIYNLESGRSLNPQRAVREKLENALNTQTPNEIKNAAASGQQIVGLGTLEDFEPHDDALLPSKLGVYVFYDITYRPVYVGQSKNVPSRIKNDHKDRFWFKRPIVQYGSFIVIEDADLRKRVEQVLIRFLKTNALTNQQSVDRSKYEPD